ncbi:MAG TPA: LCP family protein [Candidatus Limnocylindria bacterium]|nr:LCP family protein [Candidatus Limnocylindria bacterium]
MIERPRQRHPAVAAFLSFLFPGLGQAYAGDRRLAALLAVPVLALIVTALVAFALGGRQAVNSLLSASFLTALVALDIALMAWRMFAIAQVGFAQPATPGPAVVASASPMGSNELVSARRWGTILLVVVLLVTTIGMHAWAGLLVGQLNTTLGNVFSGGGHGAQPSSGPDDGPLNIPEYSWDGSDRINFLLLGIDAGGSRTEELTDTILVVSIDPVGKTAVMVSVPRDTGFMPLPDRSVYPDGVYPRKINALYSDVRDDPGRWCPDLSADAAEACALRTVQRTVGLYLGISLQYYATIDLEGFTHMIDVVGGLTLCLPGRLVDATYNGPGDTWGPARGVELPQGCSQYDGQHALAYARARKGYIEMPDGSREQLDDFKRADRQQKVLLELRREFAQLDIFFELPDMLEAIGSTVATDFPRAKAGDLASLLPLITGPDIERVVLDLPTYVDPPLQPNVNYILIPRRDDIRAEMRRLFGADYLEGWYLATRRAGPES